VTTTVGLRGRVLPRKTSSEIIHAGRVLTAINTSFPSTGTTPGVIATIGTTSRGGRRIVRRAAVSAIGAAPIVVIGRGTGIDLALVTTVAEADGDVASNKRQRASFELNSP
jgi:hypothetical protein